MNIGYYLKQIRAQKKLTLNEVAEKNDITASLLSQIENNKAQPSLSSLESLLKYYQINLSDFFKQVEQPDYILVKKNETETLMQNKDGIKITLLASKLQNNQLESYMVELQPGSCLLISAENRNISGERFLYILSGAIELSIGQEKGSLIKGDSLNFKSYLECKLKNTTTGITEILINGTPSIILSQS